MKVAKPEITAIGEKRKKPVTMEVSEVVPNPTGAVATVHVNLQDATNLVLEVTSLTGQVMMIRDEGSVPPGLHTIKLDINRLEEGIYLCSVKSENGTVTRKIIKKD